MMMNTSPALETESKNGLQPTLTLTEIIPAYNERAVIAGRTGSGKTFLAERLLWHYPYVAVLDVKNRLRWEGYDRHAMLAQVKTSEHSHLIYAPGIEELFDAKGNPGAAIEDFFRWVYMRENTMLYVDEVMGITWGDAIPYWYRAILTRGRELGVGCISATQRPVRIPQVILSEAEHYYAFELQLPQDRDRISAIAGVMFPTVTGHTFAYKRIGEPGKPGIYTIREAR